MKGYIEIKSIGEPIEIEPVLKVLEGKIFVEGVQTIDPELIGMAFKDFAQQLALDNKHFNSDYPEPVY